MCYICGKLINSWNAWKVYGHWFCSKRYADRHKLELYEAGLDDPLPSLQA